MTYNPNANKIFSTATPGLVPASLASSGKVMKDDGTWGSPLELSPETANITYYIDPSGSDSASGDLSHPLYSFQEAVNRMQLQSKDGRYTFTISIAAGTYNYDSPINIVGFDKSTIYVTLPDDVVTFNFNKDNFPSQPKIHIDDSVVTGVFNIIRSSVYVHNHQSVYTEYLEIKNTASSQQVVGIYIGEGSFVKFQKFIKTNGYSQALRVTKNSYCDMGSGFSFIASSGNQAVWVEKNSFARLSGGANMHTVNDFSVGFQGYRNSLIERPSGTDFTSVTTTDSPSAGTVGNFETLITSV